MEPRYRRFNVALYFLATIILGSIVINAFTSGHPWALTCYQCKACNLKCPLGYDVSVYVAAAATDNPDLYMSASNLQLTLEEAYGTDPDMIVEVEGNRTTANEAHTMYPGDTIVWARKLRVRDAAKFDPLEGACESMCPVTLQITNVIRDLKEDGKFRNG
jgi:ferredoxin